MSTETDPKLCFVLMPMEDPFIEVYEEVMKRTVEAAGLNCLYAGDIFEPKMIVEDIWEHIERAAVVIADLTGRNANVFYEVGYTHSLDKGKAILITQQIQHVPFDLRGFRCIEYKLGPRGLEALKTRITKAIKRMLAREPQSPVPVIGTLQGVIGKTTVGITLLNRQGHEKPFETRLANAREVSILGMALSGILTAHEAFIRESARSGCVFRILITDRWYFERLVYSGYGQESLGNEIAARILRRLLQTTDKIKLRFIRYPPPFSLLMVDALQPDGIVQVESYTFQDNTSERPHFTLTRSLHATWYDFYVKEFEIAWQGARPPDAPPDIRPPDPEDS